MTTGATPVDSTSRNTGQGLVSRVRALFLKHEWLRGYFLLSPTLLFMICALALLIHKRVASAKIAQGSLDPPK